MQGHVWAYSWPQKRASTSTDMATKCKRVSIVGVMRCEHSNWYFCSINVDYIEYTTINIMWVPIISIRVHYRFSILPIYTDYHIHLLLIYNIDKLSIKATNLLHCFRLTNNVPFCYDYLLKGMNILKSKYIHNISCPCYSMSWSWTWATPNQ